MNKKRGLDKFIYSSLNHKKASRVLWKDKDPSQNHTGNS